MMIDETLEGPFAGIRAFDWDPPKRKRNLRERHIDFQDARFVLDGPTSFAAPTVKVKSATWSSGFLRT
jgi:hypothetical protein